MLEILKIYIKTNLANSFISPSKFSTKALVFLIKKLNSNYCLYINYWNLNKLTIKNWYLLLLISKSLNRLKKTKQFIWHNSLNASHHMRIKENNEYKTMFKT